MDRLDFTCMRPSRLLFLNHVLLGARIWPEQL
jgi:hypothetical protein